MEEYCRVIFGVRTLSELWPHSNLGLNRKHVSTYRYLQSNFKVMEVLIVDVTDENNTHILLYGLFEANLLQSRNFYGQK